MAPLRLDIGIETEIFLNPHNTKYNEQHPTNEDSSKDLAFQFKQYYNERKAEGSKLRLNFDTTNMTKEQRCKYHDPEDAQPYTKWHVMGDYTMKQTNDDPKYRWPVELSSPILKYDDDEHWRREVRSHFDILESFATINVNSSCGKIQLSF